MTCLIKKQSSENMSTATIAGIIFAVLLAVLLLYKYGGSMNFLFLTSMM